MCFKAQGRKTDISGPALKFYPPPAYINFEISKGEVERIRELDERLIDILKHLKAEIDPTPIHRGVRVLIKAQMEDGDFPQQEITGVFTRNCILNYASYRNIFPMWVLGGISEASSICTKLECVNKGLHIEAHHQSPIYIKISHKKEI
nr:lupeol synthase [Quercus suber]